MTLARVRTRVPVVPIVPVTAWAMTLAAILLWPLTRSGYPLARDMVFTPQQPLDLAAIGAGSAPPRAVPVDALVALSERVVDGAVVGRIVLIAALIGAGLGAAALLRGAGLPARLAACTFAMWNPYVVERLALGQWALLWAYAALPWLVLGVLAVSGRRRWAARAVPLAAAAITPTGGIVAACSLVALVLGLRRGRREVLASVGLAVLAQLPWVVPALLTTASRTSDPAGVSAFAARSERGGVVLSLLTGGGVWDADVVPSSRTGALPVVALGVVIASAVFGARRLATLLGARVAAILGALAALGLLLAALTALPGGPALLVRLVAHVGGAGLLRDGQKWVLPLVVLEALLLGAAVEELSRRVRGGLPQAGVALAAVALPLLTLPDAAATLRTPLSPVHYPRDWSALRSIVRSGDVATLPFGSYRNFAWAAGRPVYDPASRLLRVPTVTDDRLAVSGHVVSGEDRRAERVMAALGAGPAAAGQLAALGIRWVVVEHGTAGASPQLPGLETVRTGRDATLYRIPGVVTAHRASGSRVAVIVAADIAAAAGLLGCLGLAMAPRRGFRDQRPETEPGV